jgi:hypothetical protein
MTWYLASRFWWGPPWLRFNMAEKQSRKQPHAEGAVWAVKQDSEEGPGSLFYKNTSSQELTQALSWGRRPHDLITFQQTPPFKGPALYHQGTGEQAPGWYTVCKPQGYPCWTGWNLHSNFCLSDSHCCTQPQDPKSGSSCVNLVPFLRILSLAPGLLRLPLIWELFSAS